MKAVIFDLDNTLEEWLPFEEEVEERVSQELAEKYGLDAAVFKRVFDEIKVSYLYDRSIPQDFGRKIWFSEAFAHLGLYDIDVEPIVKHYWELMLDTVRLFPGTIETLNALRGHVRLAILTDADGDKRLWKDARIKRLGLTGYFDAIVVSNDVGVNKPHPRCFLETARQLNVRPEDCFMVGDAPNRDLSGAKQLGMTTVWQRQGLSEDKKEERYPYIDFVIDDITEVVALVIATPAKIRH